MTYRIGIDAGSKTIKAVVLDENGSVAYSIYRRHRADILRTLGEVIHDLTWHLGDIEASIAVTGSAGINVAEQLDAPFVQEVVATTHAIQHAYPDADAVIELGGEDAKVIYLTGGLEQRMNATCAGGTGGFIDTIAFMLGVRPAEMSRLAHGARTVYPIASRCAVFAQTDVRPLLNAGASKSDIAASALDAVVRQTLGGLACGRPIRGKVIFLGGPLEHMPYLVYRFRRALGLSAREGIKPHDAHLFTAHGTALFATGPAQNVRDLEQRVKSIPALEDDLEHLPPLFESEDDLAAFRAQHSALTFPKKRLFDTRGPLYLGIDAGSTTVKIAVLDAERNLVHSAYEPTRGDMLKTLCDMLVELHAAIPRPYAKDKPPYAWIAHATATGYGEALLQAALGVDTGVVETAAHLRAAQHICPDVSFVLDIGGQDMKALWVRDGQVTDAVLNEACSSGCGSFIEGTAYSLSSTPWRFANGALQAKHPVDLGTKCTVFMTSRVRHAQKIGADIDDIAAGVAYSVVQNALYRIIGIDRVASMGERVVVQGGAFKSDAVLRAFELVTGVQAIRYEQAHLMGAIGAALVAAERAEEAQRLAGEDASESANAEAGAEAETNASASAAAGVDAGARAADNSPDPRLSLKHAQHSKLASREDLANLKLKRRALTCTGCANACSLSIAEFGEGRFFISGNKCDRGLDELERQGLVAPAGPEAETDTETAAGANANTSGGNAPAHARKHAPKPPNVVAAEQQMLRSFSDFEQHSPRGSVRIGLMNTLEMYEHTPFWHQLLVELGFSIVMPSTGCEQTAHEAWETVPSESVCYPAKTSHARYFSLKAKGAHAVLMPRFERTNHCPVSCSYAEALADNVSPGEGMPSIVMPIMANVSPEKFATDASSRAELLAALSPWALQAEAPLCASELNRAIDAALDAQRSFQEQIDLATQRALAWLEEDASRHAILLAGRPYHNDEALMHGIDKELQKLGFAVLSAAGLHGSAHLEGAYPWKQAKRLVNAANYTVQSPNVDLVCLQSFGCGFDALSLEEVRAVLAAAHRPFTALKIDDISDVAHIRIRLRTLAEAVESRKRRRESTSAPTAEAALASIEKPAGVGAVTNTGTTAIVPTPTQKPSPALVQQASDDAERVQPPTCERCAHLLAHPIGPVDLETARRDTVKDVCFTADVMAARAIRLVRENHTLEQITLPRMCDTCLVDAVPRTVERATGKTLRFIWEDVWPQTESPQLGPVLESEVGPRIGIVGNALLCFDPFMNDHLVDKLVDLGCTPVLPNPELVATDDVRYLSQLELFAQSGVREVIYLQSFGCLKGHVHARGALHELARRFPELHITVIDFDPEASALNRENRLRLAIEAARQRA